MGLNNIKISLNMKNKSLLSIEKSAKKNGKIKILYKE